MLPHLYICISCVLTFFSIFGYLPYLPKIQDAKDYGNQQIEEHQDSSQIIFSNLSSFFTLRMDMINNVKKTPAPTKDPFAMTSFP